jgi:mono/diheme cytochrome c family protein
MRLSEPLLIETDSRAELLPRLLALLRESDVELHWQLAFTLGEAVDASAEGAMATLAGRLADNRYIRHALISGLGGREVEFVERLMALEAWTQPGTGSTAFLKELAECVFREARPGRVDRLLAMAADQPDELAWRRLALMDGALETAPTRGSRRKPILFTSEPKGYQALARSGDQSTMDKLAKLADLITWPGQPGYVAPPEIKPLDESEQKLFELGRELYTIACSPCHQPHGQGQEGLAPPLMESEWALGSTDRLVRIILHGVGGPITVKGKLYELEMPGLGVFDDEQIAAIATYVRREWGHGASPVHPDKVAEVRSQTGDRLETWTEAELLEIP